MALINLGDSQTFGYTGSVQELAITVDGYYRLQTYGAKGGDATGTGGNGGYSSGYYYLTNGQTIYIVNGAVGDKGGAKYNGGASGRLISGRYYSGSGGGASHIALTSGTLASIGSANIDQILIVAGGGGGAGAYSSYTGGTGGGLTGGNGAGTNSSYYGSGGTQTAGGSGAGGSGSFGQGGDGSGWNSGRYAGSGGGGFYGGGGGYNATVSSNYYGGGGGGGSGYIDNLIGGYTTNGARNGAGQSTVTLALQVSNKLMGSISAVDDGTTTTLTAVPEANCIFTNWTDENGIVVSTNATYSFATASQEYLVANFVPDVDITLVYDGNYGTASYDWISASQIELVATPDGDAYFDGWYINSVLISSSATYNYTVTGDVTIEARFGRTYDLTASDDGYGSIDYVRFGLGNNDVTFTVIPNANYHFLKYEVNGVDYTSTPLTLTLTQDTTVVAYFEEDDKYHITVSTNFKNGSVFISDNDVYSGTVITLWARPFPDYNFVKWSDGNISNPRQITVTENMTLEAEYQRITDSNGIYQYRCYVKDQLDLTDPPKAFLRVNTFDIKTDLMTNANSTINVYDMATNINNGDVLVLYDATGTTLYQGVIKSMEDNRITCSQMQSFYKGKWIYNIHPSTYLEQEIAYLIDQYSQGKMYGSTWTDQLVAQRLGGITVQYEGTTSANLPTDLDKDGNEEYSVEDMEKFIYSLYEDYGIVLDFEINFSGTNYVTVKVPDFQTIKVGNNMYAIKDMSPITTIEETNRLIIYSKDKVYRTTYVATMNGIVETPSTTAQRFNITNTKIVFSDDAVSDLVSANLPAQMYNHKLTFTLVVKNFMYQFGDFNLGGALDVWHGDDYYNTVLTGYEIKKESNQNITEVNFTCGLVRTALTKLMTLGKV